MAQYNPNKKRRNKTYPCTIFKIPEDHQMYAMGWRLHVHDVDDDVFYFHDQDRMLFVLDKHGMKAVSQERMEDIRRTRANRPA